jgi:hypothetical protein
LPKNFHIPIQRGIQLVWGRWHRRAIHYFAMQLHG